ncbi:MAG: hypothetical protein E7632_07805 [Ruminococcaceae bacterium]|nr:hypothetical protein [Oscillospiraceae bacterium]
MIKTVEAEITSIMTSQRACAGVNQVRNSSANGPRRAQSKQRCEYSATSKAGVNCRRYDCISKSARHCREHKVAPRIVYTVRP